MRSTKYPCGGTRVNGISASSPTCMRSGAPYGAPSDSGSAATHAGLRLLGVMGEPRPCLCTGTSTHVTVTASGFRGWLP